MNRLREPKWIVGLVGLVVVLAGAAYWFLIRPTAKHRLPLATGTNAAVAATAATASGTNANWPALPIDIDAVQQGLARWTESPARDPFQVSEPIVPEVAPTMPSPVSQFKLKAIWQQTGGRLAVINDRILQEGEMIAGCKLERIETDRVWLQGPEKLESLIFGQVPPPPPPPRQPLTKKLRGIFGPELTPAAKPRL